MISPTTYLDLYDIFFNEIIGDIMLGVIIGLLIIWISSAKHNMSLQLALYFGILWLCVVLIANTGLLIVWALVVVGIGASFYRALVKAIER